MGKSTTPPTAGKVSARTVRLIRAPHPTGPGKMVVTEQKGRKVETTSYLLTLLESQLGGRGFQVEKISREESADGAVRFAVSERYSVLLAGGQSTCCCKWGTYGSHKKPCRHAAALLKLLERGKLDQPAGN